MRKTTKQVLSLITAAAISASAASALAADVTFNLNETSDTDRKAAIIKATYDDNGALESAEIISDSVDIFAGETTNTIHAVEEGARYFLWDSTGGMKPLADAVTASGETPTDSVETEKPTDSVDDPTPTPTIPVETEDPDIKITETWKFDFGTSENVEDGWIAVTADDVYAENAGKSPVQYGFLGTDGHGDSYGQHIDGVITKTGQNVTLKAGGEGAAASDDYLGVDKAATVAKSKIDGDYPIRFAMKAESDSYYNVKVKLTTFDKTAGATATLFSERHHAIILEESMTAGEEKIVEFNTTIQPFYLKDSKSIYNDDMLNVVVVGDNVAIESIEIGKIDGQLPTVWMYNDSTGCDYQISQPFFMLQNYGGTGSFLSKYFPKGIVAVNQGEGGLNAFDREHWGAANAHIGKGDYVYVQYGHNHKNDSTVAPGTLGYLTSIPKYYEKAHEVGAYTLYVGPIDRHNDGQYDDKNNKWSSTLSGFSKAAKYYTEILITAGKAKADEFVSKAVADANGGVSVVDATYAWADEIIAAGITADGVTDVAFVDLNQPTLDWLEDVCKTVKDIRGADKFERNATDYYFYSQRGTAVDGTHCNTAGADNTASFFFNEAEKTIAMAADSEIAAVEAEVLRPLVTGMRTTTDNAYVVPEEIVKAGAAPNSMWPTVYVPSNLPALPLVIKDITFGEDGRVVSATIYRQDAEKSIKTYGILDIEIKTAAGETKGHIYSRQIEPTGANGENFTIEEFNKYDPADLVLGETDTYTAVVRSASDPGDGSIIVDTGEDADTYSAVYEPTDIDTELLNDDFNYYGASAGQDITEYGWSFIGSGAASGAHILNNEGDIWYTEINASGGGSFYLWKNFDATDPGMTNTGKYMFEGSFNYTSGAGSVVSLVTGTNDKNRSGTARLPLFTIGDKGIVTVGETTTEAGPLSQGTWVDIRAIVDTDLGTLSVSVGGGEAATIALENYQTTSTTVLPEKLTQVHFGKDRAAYSYKVTNLHVAQLKRDPLPEYTLTVGVNDSNMGTAEIKQETEPSEPVTEETAVLNTVKTVVAKANEGRAFLNWSANGIIVSTDAEYTFRLRDNITLTANFVGEPGVEDIASFALSADKTRVKAEAETTINVNIVDAKNDVGTAITKVTNADAQWSCSDSELTVENGVITIPEGYAQDDVKKTVTVTAKINDVERTISLVLYSSKYYEDFSTITSVGEWITDSSTNSLSAILDSAADKSFAGMTAVGNGNVLVIGNNSNGSGKKLEYNRNMELSEYSVLKFGFEIEPYQIRTDGKDASVTLQFVDTEGTKVFDISVHTGGKNSSFNGTAINGFVNGTAIAVDTELDFTNKTMKYTITDAAGKQLATGTADLTATNLDRMYFSGDWQYGKFAIDNIYADYAE
ncbi:MAG: hypothetical protein J1G06_04720 [Oscillospiraceae bacterium]|nr:hypothetical protein [Oscillospiraceae bacterium]